MTDRIRCNRVKCLHQELYRVQILFKPIEREEAQLADNISILQAWCVLITFLVADGRELPAGRP